MPISLASAGKILFAIPPWLSLLSLSVHLLCLLYQPLHPSPLSGSYPILFHCKALPRLW